MKLHLIIILMQILIMVLYRFIFGCTDDAAFMNENANTDDGSCIEIIEGCIDEFACNYE